MAESFASATGGRRWPGARFLLRAGRRTLVESLYLLTAPAIAAAGLLLVLAGLCAGAAGSLVPGGTRAVAGALALARWSADLERWRIATVRSQAGGAQHAGQPPSLTRSAAASDPGLWLDVAHAVAVLPVVLVTSVVTGLWWFIGLGAVTALLRSGYPSAGSLRQPMTQERDTARAQTVAAVTAEAAALRRLERDIHDGPQQRLVRLAMELGRAQHHFGSRPEAAREALADAIV